MNVDQAKAAIGAIRILMDQNRDRLIELDAAMGDGDLGLTMTKAFAAADDDLSSSDEKDVGRYLAQAGMLMARVAPSTMGTLVATGFMRGGKAIQGKTDVALQDVARFFRAFADGMMARGKSKPGEKTVVDIVEPVAGVLEHATDDPAAFAAAGRTAAESALEATKEMVARHGRAAYYGEQSAGRQDAGAAAGELIVRGFLSIF